MDFTSDVTATVESFLKEQYYQTKHQQDNLALAADSTDFLQGVLVAAGKDTDPMLDERKTQAQGAASDANGKGAVYLDKMDTSPDDAAYRTARVAWLKDYIVAVEREYAQHQMLVEISLETGQADQVESSTIAMLECEAAHSASLKELALLKAG